MKTILFRASLAGLLAASAFAQTSSSADPRESSNPSATGQPTVRYQVADLGTFGGPFSIAFGLNAAGRIGGAAALPDGSVHPFLLRGQKATKTDLGTLGGPNAQASPPNGRDEVPIVSETSTPDPLKEDFCGFGNHLVCLGALWNGAMTPLPTLGGNNALAVLVNDRSQVIGVAENAKHDPSCAAPQVLDFEAVVWGPNPGEIHGLPPLPGDTVGFALGINNRGQVVGSSGTCDNTIVTAVGLFVGPHAVLWDNGSVESLGTLGGSMGKAGAINDRGEVAGFSSLPGDSSVHSFLWTRETGMQDLGALGDDFLGDPAGINNNTQVVGGSCDASGNCRAFFWEKGVLSDLNDLIAVDSPLYLMYGLGINDAGEIAGFALDKSTGEVHAYLATPMRGRSDKQSATLAIRGGTSETRRVVIPENVRALLQQRLPLGGFGTRQRSPR
jgi:probable HAF family extracellular repeat protein